MSPRESLAVKRGPDPDQKRNAAIAGAILLGIVVLFLAGKVMKTISTRPVEVVTRGFNDCNLKAKCEIRDATNKVVAEGSSDEATGLWTARVPAGTYTVEATVYVKETDFGLPAAHASQQSVVVNEGDATPPRVEFKYSGVEYYLEFPGRYRVHK